MARQGKVRQIGGDQIGLDDPLDEPESLREGDAD